ncbi:HK97-gp10 family putative phage morphogenesis protein [Halobacillus aidingensis]|uniref:Phage protein, HK97 gp10 family n=1 Tax=Halobacillus aidingensis TaxID=240303 RepID=A0A1H0MGM1_HALAD|nr:HK97-gp10 family putative phage morphogenesis protein [Halobacillus aidingensis]SDO79290.1 phage protein, HK97 gp10 family [Halobacillus aidingensis]
MEVQFEGIDELISELEKLEVNVKRVKNKALRKAAEVLRDRMKEEVYSHGLVERSGEARESIVMSKVKDDSIYVGTPGGVAAPGFYLYFHEMGYYNVRAKRFIPPRPFASIAMELSRPGILDAYETELKKVMKL